jgi:hypothetical protein
VVTTLNGPLSPAGSACAAGPAKPIVAAKRQAPSRVTQLAFNTSLLIGRKDSPPAITIDAIANYSQVKN